MCFSATASFIAGISLSIIGVVTLKKARSKKEIPFASIPLLFGVQQFIEGLLWTSFRYNDPFFNEVMTYTFSVYSHVLWPIFIPFSIRLLETVPWRKKVISVFLVIGTLVGAYLLYLIIKFPVISVIDKNIVYASTHFYQVPVILLYLGATCLGSLFSSHKMIIVFGALALFLFLVAYLFYTVAFFSVWCFFAAILSAIIYLHFWFDKKVYFGKLA
jgi:uncharacterized protein DUF6629